MSTASSKRCPTCNNTYDSSVSFCLHDGDRLVDAPELLGSLLDGRYRIEKMLGQGGMGTVYQARHIHIDIPVAVKVLNPELVSNQAAIERFRREAKAAGRINHPNAIQVTDFGVSPENVVYLVMEIVQGESLRDLIWEEKAIPAERTVNLMTQVCAAVEAAHKQGVIHRDLKPDNILIKREGQAEIVKVLDFGIAKLKKQDEESSEGNTLTKVGTIIGTPAYMSPEQCRGQELDARSDVYSLGIILYEMLAGDPPFDGENPVEIVAHHLKELPRPLLEARPDVPEELAAVVMRSLEKKPAQRQSSAAELSRELQEALNHTLRHASKGSRTLGSEPARITAQENISLTEETEAKTTGKSSRVASSSSSSKDTPASSTESASVTTDSGQSAPTTSRSPMMAMAAVAAVVVLAIAAYLFWPRSSTTEPGSKGSPTPVVSGGNDEMVMIPGGKFTMGRNDGDEDERPAHEVEVKPFYLDKLEVTNQQYEAFVKATKHKLPKHWTNNGSFAPGEGILPVINVTWDDATAYAAWAQKRLPTEEEWEYAARGGKQNLYPWGTNWDASNANVGTRRLTPGRSFPNDVSSFGVYDLGGNVSEWVQSSFKDYRTNNVDAETKVFRGGNIFDKQPERSTTTYRWYDSWKTPDQITLSKTGFRCAKDVK